MICLINEWVKDTKKAAEPMPSRKGQGLGFLNLHPGLSTPSHIFCELIIPTNDNDLASTDRGKSWPRVQQFLALSIEKSRGEVWFYNFKKALELSVSLNCLSSIS